MAEVCECGHRWSLHWVDMDDGNGRSGSPCRACGCSDYEEHLASSVGDAPLSRDGRPPT